MPAVATTSAITVTRPGTTRDTKYPPRYLAAGVARRVAPGPPVREPWGGAGYNQAYRQAALPRIDRVVTHVTALTTQDIWGYSGVYIYI